MGERRRSWRRPLGIVAGIAVGLLAVGWTAAGSGQKARGESFRAESPIPAPYAELHPASGGQRGGGSDWLVLRLGDQRFYWNRSARFFVPHRWVDHRFGRRPPNGTVFIDPFSGRRYGDLLKYRRDLEDSGHPPVLDVAPLRDRPPRRWDRRDR